MPRRRDGNPERDWGRPSWPSKPAPPPGERKGCTWDLAVVAVSLVLAVLAFINW